ncbi:MAG: hypothetical protein JWR44_540 [Hymenobacter sp.]|jgi:hypothetical protein|nr:hypothetical protein [Hymenobacter sp.]
MKFFLKPLCIALVSAFALVAAPTAHAQININVNPPSWGPAVPRGQQYYYIPEAGSFYDVPARQYVVSRDGKWIRTATLSGYNTANFHPVVVDYVGAQPWTRYEEYKVKYPKKGHPHGLPPGQAKKQYRTAPGQVIYYDRKGQDKHEYEDDKRENKEDKHEYKKGKHKNKD